VTTIRRVLPYVPAAGVVSFYVLYAIAAWFYPGGNYDDRREPGFSLFRNYFCDLLEPLAKNGEPNPGRGVGLVAAALIVPTLALFWHYVVALYPNQPRLRVTTRVSGFVSALATLLLLTPLHDSAVEVGGGFGLVAFFSVLIALPRAEHGSLFLGGVAAVAVSSACFFIWRTGIGVSALAGLQKLAFALFLSWVFVTSLAAKRALDRSSRATRNQSDESPR
jgi:hypothetical protein